MLKNGLYNLVAQVLILIVSVVSIPVISDRIGIDNYGIWALTMAVVNMLVNAELGLGSAVTYFLSRELGANNVRAAGQTVFISIVCLSLLSLLVATLMFLFAPNLTMMMPDLNVVQNEKAIASLRIGSAILLLRITTAAFIGIEQAYQRYDVLNILTVVYRLVSSCGAIVVALCGGNIVDLVWMEFAASLLCWLAHVFNCRLLVSNLYWTSSFDLAKCWEIFKYSSANLLEKLGALLFSSADQLLIGSLLGTSALGVYSIIVNWVVKINVLSATVVQPMSPAISALLALQKAEFCEKLSKIIARATVLNALTACLLTAGLFCCADIILNTMFPKIATSENELAFKVAAIVYGLYSLNAVGYFALYAVGMVREGAAIILVSGLLSFLGIYAGTKTAGLVGAMYGNAFYALSCVGLLLLAKKYELNLRIFLVPLMISIVTVAVLLLAHEIIPREMIWLRAALLCGYGLTLLASLLYLEVLNKVKPRAALHPTLSQYQELKPSPTSRCGGNMQNPDVHLSELFGPRVSIVTSVFNGIKTLPQTIDSVASQTYKNIEYIIVDGASTDGTVELLEQYSDRITRWYSEKDAGLYDGWNKAVSRSSGEIVFILNADDCLEPEAIERVVDVFRSNPIVDVVHTDYIRFDDDHPENNCKFVSNHPLSISDAFYKNCILSFFVRRRVYESLGLYSTEYKIASDLDFMARALNSGMSFAHVPEALVKIRNGGASMQSRWLGILETLSILPPYGVSKFSILWVALRQLFFTFVTNSSLFKLPLSWYRYVKYDLLKFRRGFTTH